MNQFNALTIAGTDPSGGAGIQADLKTFAALGIYGCSVITALVAQNTIGVQSIYHVKSDFVTAQLKSVFNDIRIDAIKIGMLAEIDIIEAVSEQLEDCPVRNIVLDPVMLAKSTDPLLSPSAIKVLRKRLLSKVAIITPNLFEAAALLETSYADNEKDIVKQGKELLSFGCNAVLMKGGHLDHSECPDWLFTREYTKRFTSPRIRTKNTHGTGCTLSSALAALQLRYKNWDVTVHEAKSWLSKAIERADTLSVGHGTGPIHHFHAWW